MGGRRGGRKKGVSEMRCGSERGGNGRSESGGRGESESGGKGNGEGIVQICERVLLEEQKVVSLFFDILWV